MNVFCVVEINDEYGDHNLCSVWSTLEKANVELDRIDPEKKYRSTKLQYASYNWSFGYAIDEMEIDHVERTEV